ncbi:MAG: pyridoxal phosphate-dependent aminotransferase [Deltaproteobacteria bacterium]|nr:pyridoxal phosphate-dependent aminotransferase [Deltaproteobacteria bacterium]
MSYDFDTVVARRGSGSLKWDLCEEGMLPMWVADMDFPAPPEVINALRQRAGHGIYGYTPVPDSYYAACQGWMQKRHGWDIRREWIVPTPGVLPAISLAVQAYTRPGDKIIIQPPVYHPFRKIIRDNGRQLVENPLKLKGNRYEMDCEHLKNLFDERTRVLILCSPHNPVGRVWSREELQGLVSLCINDDILIIADEIHADLIMAGHGHTPAALVSNEAARHVITCTAASKTFNLAGLSCSNLIIEDNRLRNIYTTLLNSMWIGWPNVFGLAATEAAYTSGEPWLEALLAYLKANYDFLATCLPRSLPGIQVFPLEGTYLAWLDFRSLGMSDDELNERILKKAGVWLDQGSMFGTGGAGFQRINIACPRQVLQEGLKRIVDAFIM